MRQALLILLVSASAFAQESSSAWLRTQWNDKLTGDQVVAYQLFPQSDGAARKPYIAITCDLVGNRFTYGYYTGDTVYLDGLGSTTVRYRVDAEKPKSEYVTVRRDFRTIDIDARMLLALSGGREFAISYPSVSGYTVTDVFVSSPLPAQYASDCYTDKMRRKIR